MEIIPFFLTALIIIGNASACAAIALIYCGYNHPRKLVTACDIAFTRRDVSRFDGSFLNISLRKIFLFRLFFASSIIGISVLLWGGFSFSLSWMPDYWSTEDSISLESFLIFTLTAFSGAGLPFFLESAIRSHAWYKQDMEDRAKNNF